jgi:type I restriction enzyme R subunit
MEAERQTRLLRIDPRLKAAGWRVVPATADTTGAALAVEEFETPLGPADYALFDAGRCVGVVEAKKLTLGPQGVLVQAERYSKAVEQKPMYQGEYGVPFLYVFVLLRAHSTPLLAVATMVSRYSDSCQPG